MTYEAFINQVRARLTPLPPEERQAMADYYGELFEDYIENGLSEDEAAVSLLAALDETLRKDYDCTLFERPKKFGKLLNNLEKNGFDGYVSAAEPEKRIFFANGKEKQN